MKSNLVNIKSHPLPFLKEPSDLLVDPNFQLLNLNQAMDSETMKRRFKKFAIDVAILITKLPKDVVNNTYNGQLIRSSSSSAANYRAACRGKSTADFIHKLKIVEEELDESVFFLEMLEYFNPEYPEFKELEKEGNELLAIIVASIKTSRGNQYFGRPSNRKS